MLDTAISTEIFFVLRGPNFQWNLFDISPVLKIKPQSSKNIFFEDCDFIIFFIFVLFEDCDFHSVNSHRRFMVTFSFNLMARLSLHL